MSCSFLNSYWALVLLNNHHIKSNWSRKYVTNPPY
jgi:hypothetical protein